MSPKRRRYSLKSSEAKDLMSKVTEQLGASLSRFVNAKANIEVVEVESKLELLLLERNPVLFKTNEQIYPTLAFTEVVESLPKAVVDMGAVGHVCNGADIMAPGIVRFEGEFSQGSLIVIVDLKHRKPLALGEVLYDSEAAKATRKGVVIKNVHFVGDEIWRALKELGE
jgi:PUA domain protein